MKKIFISIIALCAILLIPIKGVFAGGHYSGPDLSGQKVKIFGPWLAPEDESFRDVLSIFEKATGASVEYGGSDEFEQIINIDCKAGNPADIAVFPQPGLAANIAATGCLAPQGNDLKQMVLDHYAAGQSWVDLTTYADKDGKDQFYGIFFRVNVKSLVWYSPDNFEDNGYEVPETMEELLSLTEKWLQMEILRGVLVLNQVVQLDGQQQIGWKKSC